MCENLWFCARICVLGSVCHLRSIASACPEHGDFLTENSLFTVLLFLGVFVSLVFFLLGISLVFLSVFCLFFRIFKGSRTILGAFEVFLGIFEVSKEKKDRVFQGEGNWSFLHADTLFSLGPEKVSGKSTLWTNAGQD